MTLILRQAKQEELPWVNQQYNQLSVLPSGSEHETIAIAEINGEKAGLGRLIEIDTAIYELGGIYVLPPFRGRKLSRTIIDYLISFVIGDSTIYCLPFAGLLPVFWHAGFAQPADFDAVPEEILKKYAWYSRIYDRTMKVLVLQKKPNNLMLPNPVQYSLWH